MREGSQTSAVFPKPSKKMAHAGALKFFDSAFAKQLGEAGFRVFLECNFDLARAKPYIASFGKNKKVKVLDRFELGTECVTTFAESVRTGDRIAMVVQDADLLEPFPFIKSRAYYPPNGNRFHVLRKHAFMIAPKVPPALKKMTFTPKSLTFPVIKKYFDLLKKNSQLEPIFQHAVKTYDFDRLGPLMQGLLMSGHLEDTLFVLLSTEATQQGKKQPVPETPVLFWSRGHKLLPSTSFRKLSPATLKTVILSLLSGKLEPGLIEWIRLHRS